MTQRTAQVAGSHIKAKKRRKLPSKIGGVLGVIISHQSMGRCIFLGDEGQQRFL